jgi:CRISPR/Cas system-associated exonuclease Cas4 (RecB family)
VQAVAPETPAPAREGPPEFAWSLSRHDSFATCKRRYFYSYYAAYEDAEIQRLKKLSALPMWAGTVVHDTLERLLREHEAMPSSTQQEVIVKAAVHEHMLRDFRDSEQGSPRFRLFEHEYVQPIAPEDKKLLVTIVMRSLRNAFASATLREAFELGRGNFLTVEDLVSFEAGATRVRLRMDLAFRDRAGRVLIVDWKTGRSEGRFNETQLAGYALYAQQVGWVQAPEELSTELAYLVIPKFVRRQVVPATLEHARRFIDKSALSMRALLVDPAQNRARLEDFPMIDRPQICRRCNFRRLCFPRGLESPAAQGHRDGP